MQSKIMMTTIVLLFLVGTVLAVNENAYNGKAYVNPFWYCCKPLCSNFKSCAKDGITPVPSYTYDSCLGLGEGAFTCNNNQPWAINETLGYGFAFGLFANEKPPCCSCFQLDNNDGKRLIVQLSSSEKTKGTNWFQLLIPGSGVGDLNMGGCQMQWNTEENSWGDKFSGVVSREQCLSLLPQQLQKGCLFRFDFFNNLTVDRATYTQVECPKELVDISGCQA